MSGVVSAEAECVDDDGVVVVGARGISITPNPWLAQRLSKPEDL